MFRVGPENPVQLLILEPLFEEANRMRRTLAKVMRNLDSQGIGSAIPDLPGMAESPLLVRDATLADWRSGAATAADFLRGSAHHVLIASFRGAAIFDDAPALPVWRCAPETGARLVRDMKRAALASDSAPDDARLAGHALSPALIAALEQALPVAGAHIHTARLETDAAPADTRLSGTPVWRRAEPGEDPRLTDSITASLSPWIATCARD